jgi:hypothetical protein
MTLVGDAAPRLIDGDDALAHNQAICEHDRADVCFHFALHEHGREKNMRQFDASQSGPGPFGRHRQGFFPLFDSPDSCKWNRLVCIGRPLRRWTCRCSL